MTDKEITLRLERLERDNRRLKRVAAAGVAIAAVLSVIYAGSCSSARNAFDVGSSPEKITAHEMDVVDNTGKVRVQIAVDCLPATNCWPSIKMFDQEGKPATSIGAGTLTVSGGTSTATLLRDHLQFSVAAKGIAPRVTAELGSGTGGGGLLSLAGNGASYVLVDANSPGIEMQDSQGYTMNLGSVDLTTVISGQTSQTTADSIVMFGNDKKHHLIWSAP
jgi:hypothetical protein